MWFQMSNIFSLYFILVAYSFISIGMGLFIMGKNLKLMKLLKLSIIITTLIVSFWLMPINNGAKTYLTIFLSIIVLFKLEKFSLFTATGAVLIGSSIITNIEWAFSFFYSSPIGLPWLFRVLRVSPAAFLGIVVTIYLQVFFTKKKTGSIIEDYGHLTSAEQKRIL